ncbi:MULTISPECIES: DUF559 domain-containing protein [unclassified Streptomyces]|jgi:very-short-patch-repair endonuclease|uniref:DUF559 domain-containing protein n=1 Tax=unclassified Streptomyces TaxID=2593676 RepID=UPI00034E372A|nr:DUF559 domain-containing protein [Streptomyces sp. HGB0020]EPD65610.1 hypothetical protein HMPREF1211_02165 [Streptomyces sp. HGB0020]
MSDELATPDMSLALDAPQNTAIVSEWLLGTSALLMQHQGATETAELIADVTSLEVRLWDTQFDQEGYRIVLVVEPHLYPRYDEAALKRIENAMSMVLGPAGKDIDEFHVRPQIPRLASRWREQVKTANGPKPSNQGRKVRLEPDHRVEDQLYFTNEYERELYQVLKKRQAALPDSETIGIMPLGGMRVRRRVLEPDFLITYRGRVAVIELDGPHHKGRAASDHSRDRQLRHAGVSFVERLNVEEVTTLAEVEKFVDDFLTQLGRQ